MTRGGARTVKVTIKGHVQGVWYRGWTVREAHQLGLAGWVRNLADGSVEAVFSGDGQRVQAMIERCWQGPPAADVKAIDEIPFYGPVKPGFSQMI